MVILSLCGEKYADPAPTSSLDRLLARLAGGLKALAHAGQDRPRAGVKKPA